MLPFLNYFKGDQIIEALMWLYPNKYVMDEMVNKCILASTNEVVDI